MKIIFQISYLPLLHDRKLAASSFLIKIFSKRFNKRIY